MAIQPSTKKGIFFTFGLTFLASVLILIGFGYYLVSPSGENDHSRVFLIKKGASLKEVAARLENEEIISNKDLFLLWGKITGKSRAIKSGEYMLNSSMAPLEIMDILSRGNIITYPVTIPEGFNRREIARLLEEKGLADREEFLAITDNPSVTESYGIEGPNLEGYLFPDTYLFVKGLNPRDIVDAMVKRFFEVFEQFREKLRLSGLTMEETIILASIVEKETAKPDERPLIAGVFLNRLKMGIKLETDPTVIYGIEDFDGNLTKKDLGRPTPYNTYLINGLPPGPIASPGVDSIRSVLYPADSKYIYFVSKNDGSHHFSKTYREHSLAVEKYQKKRKSEQAKSP